MLTRLARPGRIGIGRTFASVDPPSGASGASGEPSGASPAPPWPVSAPDRFAEDAHSTHGAVARSRPPRSLSRWRSEMPKSVSTTSPSTTAAARGTANVVAERLLDVARQTARGALASMIEERLEMIADDRVEDGVGRAARDIACGGPQCAVGVGARTTLFRGRGTSPVLDVDVRSAHLHRYGPLFKRATDFDGALRGGPDTLRRCGETASPRGTRTPSLPRTRAAASRRHGRERHRRP